MPDVGIKLGMLQNKLYMLPIKLARPVIAEYDCTEDSADMSVESFVFG